MTNPFLVVTCDDATAYRSLVDEICTRRPSGPSPLPMLSATGTDTRLCRRIAAEFPTMSYQRWRSEYREGSRSTVRIVDGGAGDAADAVIVAIGSDALIAATVLSLYTGRRLAHAEDVQAFFDLFESYRDDATQLLVIGMPAQMTGRVIRELANRTPTASTGVLAAHTLDSLSQVVAWRLLSDWRTPGESRHLLLFSDLGLSEAFCAPGTTSVFASDFQFPKEVEAGDCELELFALRGTGTSIHIEMGDAQLLCGKRPDFPVAVSARFHSCQVSNYCAQDPHNNKTRISIADINTKVLYAQSCRGLSLGDSDQSLDLNLALGAAESGTLAYISMIKRASGNERHLAMASSCLRSGQPLGKIAQYLSQLHINGFDEPPSYLLFGDPQLSFGTPADPEVECRHAVEPESGGLSIHVTVQNALFWSHRVPFQDLPGAYRKEQIYVNRAQAECNEIDSEAQPIVDCYRDGGELVILCCLPAPQPMLKIRIDLSTHDSLAQQLELFARRIGQNTTTLLGIGDSMFPAFGASAEGRRKMKVDLERVVSDAAPIRASIGAIANAVSRASYTTQAQRDSLRKRLEQCRTRLVSLERAAIANSTEWAVPQYFSSMYDREYVLQPERLTEKRCPTCGERLDIVISRSVFHSGAERELRHCQRCLLVSDRPAESVEVAIFGLKEASYSCPHRIDLVCVNQHDFPVSVCGTFRFYNSIGVRTLADHHPEVVEIHLNARDEKRISVEIPVSPNAMPGNHQIMFLYMSETGLSAAYTNLHLSQVHGGADCGSCRQTQEECQCTP